MRKYAYRAKKPGSFDFDWGFDSLKEAKRALPKGWQSQSP